MDLTEAEDIKKRRQKYTEELYKTDLNDSDDHDGAVAHLEPDILEYEVKWPSGSITTNKASGDVPVELFQILNLENSAVAMGLEKLVFIPIPKKGNVKECSNYHTIALISHSINNAQNSPSQASAICEP